MGGQFHRRGGFIAVYLQHYVRSYACVKSGCSRDHIGLVFSLHSANQEVTQVTNSEGFTHRSALAAARRPLLRRFPNPSGVGLVSKAHRT